jgi:hypothetical protein
MITLLAEVAGDPGLPSLAVYGVAAFPMALMLAVIRWCLQQMQKKDDALDQLNVRLVAQGDAAIRQAEKLAPLISEAARVIEAAVDQRDHDRRRDRDRQP